MKPTPRPTPKPSASPTPTPKPAAPLFTHGSRTRKWIALTIDDCSSRDASLADLAILQKYKIKATWFCKGVAADAYPDVMRTIDAAGMPMGNHTQTHPLYPNLAGLTYAQDLAEIKAANATFNRILGHPLIPYLRPPGGGWNTQVLQAAAAAGEKAVVRWDCETGDTTKPYDDTAAHIANAEKCGQGSIMLMHANLPYTQLALPTIIEHFLGLGYTFATIPQMLGA